MQAILKPEFLTVEDYLAGEETSDIRHEYLGGMAYAMAGGTDAHNTIALNFASGLLGHLRGRSCRVFMADIKARLLISDRHVFYYPDVMVTCDQRDNHPNFKCYPTVLIEVLSESTESTDRREKFWNYTQLESLQEYILAAQDKMEVTLFRRSTQWTPEVLTGPDEQLFLPSIEAKFPLRAIYERVAF